MSDYSSTVSELAVWAVDIALRAPRPVGPLQQAGAAGLVDDVVLDVLGDRESGVWTQRTSSDGGGWRSEDVLLDSADVASLRVRVLTALDRLIAADPDLAGWTAHVEVTRC